MGKTSMTREADVFACQRRCSKTDGCMHFSYWKLAGDCHLQDAYALRQTMRYGFVSGPFQCWSNILNHDQFVKYDNFTYLSPTFGCIELGTMYTPTMVTPKVFAPDIHRWDAIVLCQQLCAVTNGCVHFTIQLPRVCNLVGAGAKPLHHFLGVVSGPAKCPQSLQGRYGTANMSIHKKFLATPTTIVVMKRSRFRHVAAAAFVVSSFVCVCITFQRAWRGRWIEMPLPQMNAMALNPLAYVGALLLVHDERFLRNPHDSEIE